MSIKRRTFLKGTLAGSTVGVAVGAGLLTPQAVLAAWPKSAFDAKDPNKAMEELVGTASPESSDKITVKAPDIAENGAVVPITVEADMQAKSISLVAVKNPAPLVASFDMTDQTTGYISTRIKMGQTSDVVALVESGGKVYKAAKEVKVTIGGCGG